MKNLLVFTVLSLFVSVVFAQEKGSFTDSRDGVTYQTVTIVGKTWMAENLKYLPSVNKVDDGSESEAKYYVYDYNGTDVDAAKQTDNYKTYGVLYNWKAAKNSCPTGWHLPSDAEWKTLEMALGMSQAEVDKVDFRGTDEGSKLTANTNLWKNNDLVKNSKLGSSGFFALQGGLRDADYRTFDYVGDFGFWWSSSQSNASNAWFRSLNNSIEQVGRGRFKKSHGFSVRCVKD